jgi:hypothetical protein
MKTITLYNSLGETQGILSSNDPDAFNNGFGELSAIEGSYNNNYYIKDGQAYLKGPDPSTAEVNYYFDYATTTWRVDFEKTADSQRTIRNQLLGAVDRINPVWYSSLTVDQQQELIAYRQALLDVPGQTGFPTQVEWPAKPAWL